MNNPVTAIYENGILRPLTPLNLPEQVQVRITIQPFDKLKELSDPYRIVLNRQWLNFGQI